MKTYVNLFSVALAAMCFTAMVCSASANVSRPNLVPVPQEIADSGVSVPFPAGARVVCDQPDDETIRTGVARIHGRVNALGGPQVSEGQTVGSEKAPLKIVVGVLGKSPQVQAVLSSMKSVDTKGIGAQGYVIHCDSTSEPSTILIAGVDAQGALYGCVTFCQMLRRGENGVLIDTANVRDWPDFTYRVIGRWRLPKVAPETPGSQEKALEIYKDDIEYCKQYMDWCLDYKINYITSRNARGQTNVQSYNPTWRRALREIADYGRRRGVFLEWAAYSAIDGGPGMPGAGVEGLFETHGVRYTWSHDDLIREQGHAFGKICHDIGIPLIYLHAPDTNAGRSWTARSASCQKRWRDDQRAEADAHVMNLLYEEIQKENPGTVFAAVFVPYTPTTDEVYLAYQKEIGSLIPEDMLVCTRERPRKYIEHFKKTYAPHPIYYYHAAIQPGGWMPLFSTSVRTVKTFDFDDPRDLYFSAQSGDFWELNRAVSANYAWNTDAPGAGWQREYKSDPFRDGTEPAAVAKDLVDALCVQMFGPVAGPMIGDAVRCDISWSGTESPHEFARVIQFRLSRRLSVAPEVQRIIDKITDYTYMFGLQDKGARKGLPILLDVSNKLARGEVAFDSITRQRFNFLLSYFAAVRALGSARHAIGIAAEHLNAGDRGTAAAAVVDEALRDAAASKKMLADVAERIGGAENWYVEARGVGERLERDVETLRVAEKLAKGVAVEQADTPENLKKAAFLLRGKGLKVNDGRNIKVELLEPSAKTTGHKVALFTQQDKDSRGGITFDPIDIRPYIAAGGHLRMHVNSAGKKGWQTGIFTFKFVTTGKDGAPSDKKASQIVYLHHPYKKERMKNRRPGCLLVDDFKDTWQFVSIPLEDLKVDGGDYLVGLDLTFTSPPGSGGIFVNEPLYIADPYVVGNTEPVVIERNIGE